MTKADKDVALSMYVLIGIVVIIFFAVIYWNANHNQDEPKAPEPLEEVIYENYEPELRIFKSGNTGTLTWMHGEGRSEKIIQKD